MALSAIELADLLIGIAYFLIPLEILLYQLKRRSRWHVEHRWVALSLLFFSFIALCGVTHILSVVGPPYKVALLVKIATAIVSVATAIMICWCLPAAMRLPQYVQAITYENRLMRDFRAITTAMRRDLREEAIIHNVRQKLRRILLPNTLLEVGSDGPPTLPGPHDVLSLPILGELQMHLRRAHLNEAQVIWLQDVCIQMKQTLQQAAYLNSEHGHHHHFAAATAEGKVGSTGGGVGPSGGDRGGTASSNRPGLSTSASTSSIASSEPTFERTAVCDLELAKLRVKCSSALSRVRALTDVCLELGEMTPEQRRCLKMIHDSASSLDILSQ